MCFSSLKVRSKFVVSGGQYVVGGDVLVSEYPHPLFFLLIFFLILFSFFTLRIEVMMKGDVRASHLPTSSNLKHGFFL